MAKLSTAELIDAFRELTLVELSEFIKQFEEAFDVTAATPTVNVAAPPPADEDVEEKSEFEVVLEAVGERKIHVIKVVRTLTSLGLKEAKDLVDHAPTRVLEKVDQATAGRARVALVEAGATATVR